MIKRCPECGSWDAQCMADKPNPTCGCKRCSHATIARLREAICELVAAESYMKNAQERWNEGRANTEQMGAATRRLHAANKVIAGLAREGK